MRSLPRFVTCRCYASAGVAFVFPVLLLAQDPFTAVQGTPLTAVSGASVGSAWADFDRDGDLDVVVCGHVAETRLYRQEGDGSFSLASDVLTPFVGRSHACVWGDFNNDGYPDLFVAVRNGGNDRLFVNQGGIRLEPVVGVVPVEDGGDSIAASWSDIDRDGYLDLLVSDLSSSNRLYHNLAGAAFARVETDPVVEDKTASMGCVWGDYDNDGDADLFVCNGGNQNNALYRNQGNGSFVKVTDQPFVADGGYSDSAAWGDYDNDGDVDLFVANRLGKNHLYRNEGNGTFSRVDETPFSVDKGESNGCRWLDYDNDGWLDLFVGNWEGEQSFLYHNQGDGHFQRVSQSAALNAGNAVTVNAVDYDGDGFADLYSSTWTGVNTLFRNNTTEANWLGIDCEARISNRSCYGVKVRALVNLAGQDIWQYRELDSGDGWGSGSHIVLFGLGEAMSAKQVEVTWPSGVIQNLTDIPANQTVKVTEPGEYSFAVVPAGFELLEDDGYSDTLGGMLRLQEVYGATNFPDLPMLLNGLAFRRDAATVPFDNGVALLTLRLSTTSIQPDAMSSTFAANYGATVATVYDGAIGLASGTESQPGSPAPFEIAVPFNEPFSYDPADGNLLVEVVIRASTGIGRVDQSNELDDHASRAFSLSPDATQATYRDSGGDVLRFDYVPAGPVLRISPAGGWRDGPVLATITSWQMGGEIRYTLDGSEPTPTSPVFEHPLNLDASTILRAAVFSGDQQVSEVVGETYVNQSQPLVLGGVTAIEGNQITLGIEGWEGFSFEVLSTTSYRTWGNLGQRVNLGGHITFVDSLARLAARFYRLKLVEP